MGIHNKGHNYIDAEKLSNFIESMIQDKFVSNFVAYKIAENEEEFLKLDKLNHS